MSCETVVPVQRGTRAQYRFVGRDSLGDPIDLDPTDRFFITMTSLDGSVTYDTVTNPTVLFIEEDVLIEPEDAEPFTADCVTLDLTPTQSRAVLPGNLTEWELERWALGVAADQENWGNGRFNGLGGLTPDA